METTSEEVPETGEVNVGKRVSMIVDGKLKFLWRYPCSRSQREAEEFFMRWVRLGSVEPPTSQHVGTIDQQQKAEDSGKSGQGIPSAAVDTPVRPDGPKSPPRKKKAGRQGTECRDRWRLGIEFVVLVVGAISLGLLFFTLQETIQATRAATLAAKAAQDQATTAKIEALIAQKQMELSERPWVSVEVAAATPLSIDKNGLHLMVLFTLKNLGHSPASYIRLERETLLVGDTGAAYSKQQEICAPLRKQIHVSSQGGRTLLPGEQAVELRGVGFKKVDFDKART
jgi:hypothetical protein